MWLAVLVVAGVARLASLRVLDEVAADEAPLHLLRRPVAVLVVEREHARAVPDVPFLPQRDDEAACRLLAGEVLRGGLLVAAVLAPENEVGGILGVSLRAEREAVADRARARQDVPVAARGPRVLRPSGVEEPGDVVEIHLAE